MISSRERLEISNPTPNHSRECQLFIERRCGLSAGYAVLSHELSVWIYLESRLFSVRFDYNFVVPFAVRIIFSYYPNDFSASRFLLDRLLDRGGKRAQLDRF